MDESSLSTRSLLIRRPVRRNYAAAVRRRLDWGSVACLCLILSGMLVILGAVMSILAYTLERDPEHSSLAKHYGVPTNILGVMLLTAGVMGISFGTGLVFVGACRDPDVHGDAEDVDDGCRPNYASLDRNSLPLLSRMK